MLSGRRVSWLCGHTTVVGLTGQRRQARVSNEVSINRQRLWSLPATAAGAPVVDCARRQQLRSCRQQRQAGPVDYLIPTAPVVLPATAAGWSGYGLPAPTALRSPAGNGGRRVS